MDFQKLITSNIRKLRTKLGITQEEFAEKVGLSSKAISNIERNKYMPSAATINKICEEFDITPDMLCLPDDSLNTKSDVIRRILIYLNSLDTKQLKHIEKIVSTFTNVK